jgi:hypothetical protein
MNIFKRKSSGIPLYQQFQNAKPLRIKGITDINTTEKFQVINKGINSLISANLKKGDSLETRVGMIICSSGAVSTQLSGLKNLLQSMTRKMSGSSFFTEIVGYLIELVYCNRG